MGRPVGCRRAPGGEPFTSRARRMRQGRASDGRLTQRLECHPHTVEVTGSNPVAPIRLRAKPLANSFATPRRNKPRVRATGASPPENRGWPGRSRARPDLRAAWRQPWEQFRATTVNCDPAEEALGWVVCFLERQRTDLPPGGSSRLSAKGVRAPRATALATPSPWRSHKGRWPLVARHATLTVAWAGR